MWRSQGHVFADSARYLRYTLRRAHCVQSSCHVGGSNTKDQKISVPWLRSKCILTKKKFLVEEKGLKAQRQIPLCLPTSLQHYFKVMLKPVPITWGHQSRPSILKSYSAPVQTGRVCFCFFLYQGLISLASPGWSLSLLGKEGNCPHSHHLNVW